MEESKKTKEEDFEDPLDEDYEENEEAHSNEAEEGHEEHGHHEKHKHDHHSGKHKSHDEHHSEKESKSSGSNPWMYVSIFLAVLLVGSLFFTFSALSNLNRAQPNQPSNPQQPSQPSAVEVSADDDAFLGDADAPVTMIEFSDFECPFCGRFWSGSVEQIKSEYVNTGKVKFVYRDFPLSNIHANAVKAAEAAECAGDQDKYYEYHDTLFRNQQALEVGSLKAYAVQLGLDTDEFNSCLDSGKHNQEVGKDFQDGVAAGVSGTPTIFINGQMLVGAQPYSVVKATIEEELAKVS